MIYYGKMFDLMKLQGKTTYDVRNQKVVGQDGFYKMKRGTGIYEEGRDPSNLGEDGKATRKLRINAVDTKTIEGMCEWLHCQPSDIMEYIPNTMGNAKRLCEILECTEEELPSRVPIIEVENESVFTNDYSVNENVIKENALLKERIKQLEAKLNSIQKIVNGND